tara:strand:+ start:82 stop:219 length:138 start_codon:yes stop_codon:yes gene_type:complete
MKRTHIKAKRLVNTILAEIASGTPRFEIMVLTAGCGIILLHTLFN